MGLVSRLFPELIMTFFWRLKSIDAGGMKSLEFCEIVDPQTELIELRPDERQSPNVSFAFP
jgi:hypothetical protein